MSIPTKKQLLVQSLKALHKSRLRTLFRLKAIRGKTRRLGNEETDVMARLIEINKKMAWELSHNGAALKDRE